MGYDNLVVEPPIVIDIFSWHVVSLPLEHRMLNNFLDASPSKVYVNYLHKCHIGKAMRSQMYPHATNTQKGM